MPLVAWVLVISITVRFFLPAALFATRAEAAAATELALEAIRWGAPRLGTALGIVLTIPAGFEAEPAICPCPCPWLNSACCGI